jgi:hypothetical protein
MGLLSRGTQWSSFCGVSRSDFERALTDALAETELDYDRREGSGSFMLGGDASTVFDVETPDGAATITVHVASGDPMLRFLSSFRTGGEESLGDVCVVEVALDDSAAESRVRTLLSRVASSLPRDPASVGHHPRFRFAPIARWRIERKWNRWLD